MSNTPRACVPTAAEPRVATGKALVAWEKRLRPEEKEAVRAWGRDGRHFHQLRYNAGSEIRRAFGLEAAQLALGHASAQITDAVYAERDLERVVSVMREIG